MTDLKENQFVVEFSASAAPAVEIESGDEVCARVLDWCFREVNDHPETWPRAAQAPRCPLGGPIAVRGAKPGDALEVEVLEIRPQSPGFMVMRPGCGPMGDQVTQTEVVRIPLENGHALLPGGIRVQLAPMLGVIGTAPAGDPVPSLHAGDHGGNMDTREIAPGSVVFLPVRAPGGLLAIGDVHAAMGDGELGGSGVEVNATVRLRVKLIPNLDLPRPRVVAGQQMITLATREDVKEAIHLATADMIGWLEKDYGLSFRDALLLIGAAGSLRFSHVINKPGATVKLILDRALAPTLSANV